ncbi:MAG TPA: right-handed parallel beta-helix repeat-containing protein [Ideonella sp.]|uniref:right-handed parallel beta-helix repeat-containing protein n=1 Tax=Ideonella sp. TaxID=1929293 RepID=UPI002E32E178|nr:right-handed parallel beta-helix repeat-containing protein [Ideonella sp.]HEX5684322.1 right-handed parallel beta-helix repeat-containing protein [Ideonella sp.]
MSLIRKTLATAGLLALQGLPSAAVAAHYYVSASGTADNSGPGTREQPWGNLQRAITDVLQAGDTLTVVGHYTVNSRVLIVKNPSGQAITINGEPLVPGGGHQLTCAVPRRTQDTDPTPDCIAIEDSSNLVLANLVLDGTSTPEGSLIRIKRSHHIRVSDSKLQHSNVYGIYLDGQRNVDHSDVFERNEFINNKNTALYLMLGNNLTVSRNLIDTVTDGDGIVIVEAVGATVANNTVRNVRKVVGSQGKDGIKIRPSENVVIQGNHVENIAGSGIYLADPYDWAIRKRHAGVKVLDNTVTLVARVNEGDGTPRCQGFGWPSALNVSRTDDAIVQNNSVYRNYGEGITLNDATRATVKLNDAHDNFGVNYYLNNASNSVVDRNESINDPTLTDFFRCGAPAGGIGMANERADYDNHQPLSRLRITNNIVVNSRFGINFYWEKSDHYHPRSMTGLKKVDILNNTVSRTWENALAIVDTGNHTGNHVQSNIWKTDSAWPVAKVPAVGFDCLANLWWAPTSPGACASHADVLADPQFIDANGSSPKEYMLAAGSPAIDAAQYSIVMPSIWHDYFGTKRALSAWDIGAHEYKP